MKYLIVLDNLNDEVLVAGTISKLKSFGFNADLAILVGNL